MTLTDEYDREIVISRLMRPNEVLMVGLGVIAGTGEWLRDRLRQRS